METKRFRTRKLTLAPLFAIDFSKSLGRSGLCLQPPCLPVHPCATKQRCTTMPWWHGLAMVHCVTVFPTGDLYRSFGNSQQKHLGLLHSGTCFTVAPVSYEASLSIGTLGGDHPRSLTFKVQSHTLTEEQISCLISTMLYPKTRQPHSIGR